MRRKRGSGSGNYRRKLGVSLAVLLGMGGGLLWYLYVFLQPENLVRSEIYRGVYLTVQDIPRQLGSGKVMIAEIHWDEPGVELYHRPFHSRASGRKQYRLFPADFLRWQADLDLMVNTTRYYPQVWWKSIPFKQVNSLETVVWKGEVSHIHPQSYMFGWDKNGNFLLEFSKPPTEAFLDQLDWGLGVQAISIHNGHVREAALDPNEVIDARTFIGVDPVRKVLWLIVGERISERGINTVATSQGVMIGGQLDTQDASTMIIGSGAREVRTMTGIRGRRMLAGVLGVRAERIPAD